jgi:undecaprenyl-diphosphatase
MHILGTILAPVVAGMIVAAVIGWLSIRWLIGYVSRHSLTLFAAYCALVGIGCLAWLWI